MRNLVRVAAGLVLSIVLAAGSAAHPDPQVIAAGKALATGGKGTLLACDSCHAGAGPADSPLLAGLDAAYLGAQLLAYTSGLRQDAQMTVIAKAMDEKTAADVAAYYASLPPATSPPAPPSSAPLEVGAQLAQRGDWSVRIPRCAACHGANGHGVGAAFPAIAGQRAGYLASQLKAWKSGARRGDPQGLMRAVALRMSDAQIAAVSAYYASLPMAAPPATGDAR